MLAFPARSTDPARIACVSAPIRGGDAVVVVDDTALPKKGAASVGVAHQHAGVLAWKIHQG